MKQKLALCLLVLGWFGWIRTTEGSYRLGFAPGFDLEGGLGSNSLLWGLINPEGKWNGEFQVDVPPGPNVEMVQPILPPAGAQGGSPSSYNPWPAPRTAARPSVYPQPYVNPMQPRPPVYPASYSPYGYSVPQPYYPPPMPYASYGGYYPPAPVPGNAWPGQSGPLFPAR